MVSKIDVNLHHGLQTVPNPFVCVAGVFDGVHKGHQSIIRSAQEQARSTGKAFVILTFDCDPDELFHPQRLRKIDSNSRRLHMLEEIGPDYLAVIRFTEEFAALSAAEFLDCVFANSSVSSLHVGSNFHFGSKAAGGVDCLQSSMRAYSAELNVHELLEIDGRVVSSTLIRTLLESGDDDALEQANSLLGRPYSLEGVVERGRGEGAGLGFKTANILVPDQLKALADGVYAAYAVIDGKRWKAAVNVGVAPTFKDRTHFNCEAHILDFDGEIYGKTIRVEFVHRLRGSRKFDSREELIATVLSNIDWVRNNLS